MRSDKACLVASTFALSACWASAGMTLRDKPQSDDDLRVSGLFRDTSGSSVMFAPRSALLAVAGVTHLSEKPADSIAAADLTVLPLDRLLDAIPLDSRADGIVLVGSDRWESFLPVRSVSQIHPYLLLAYAGRTPAQGWPKFGPTENLAPYYCNWSAALGPMRSAATPYGSFDATQIVEIRAVNTAERYGPFFSGPMAHLTPDGFQGRRIFLRECNNCHQGPRGVGGNTSQRPFTLLQVHAALNTAYFRTFVRNPAKFYPATVMPSHEYFTDAMMDQLIAFLSEAKAAGVN